MTEAIVFTAICLMSFYRLFAAGFSGCFLYLAKKIKIVIKVIIPITVVNIPIFLDLVQPAKEIIVINEIIPDRKVLTPIIRGNFKSLCLTSIGYPLVVIISTPVIAKTVIKKKQAANIEAIIIFLVRRVFVLETNRLATTAIENPASKELIVIVISANLFQYSNVISVIIKSICKMIYLFFISFVFFYLQLPLHVWKIALGG